MKILTATTVGKSISLNCAAITRVEESLVHPDKCVIFTHNEVYGIVVDMPYLEVVGFLKAIDD